MKHLLYKLALLIGLMFALSACDWEIDDEDDFTNYLMSGSWYPESKSGLTDCQYNSYFRFDTDGIVRYYDCSDQLYDDANFSLYDNQLYLDFNDGRESYSILQADEGVLHIRDNNTGIYYYYTRQ